MADFDWPLSKQVTCVTLTWYQVYGNLHCAHSTTRVIEPNSDDRDHRLREVKTLCKNIK